MKDLGKQDFAQELANADNQFSVVDAGTGAVFRRDVLLREAQKLSKALEGWGLQTGDCVVLAGTSTVRLELLHYYCLTDTCEKAESLQVQSRSNMFSAMSQSG